MPSSIPPARAGEGKDDACPSKRAEEKLGPIRVIHHENESGDPRSGCKVRQDCRKLFTSDRNETEIPVQVQTQHFANG